MDQEQSEIMFHGRFGCSRVSYQARDAQERDLLVLDGNVKDRRDNGEQRGTGAGIGSVELQTLQMYGVICERREMEVAFVLEG